MSEHLSHSPERRSETIDTSAESAANAERLREEAKKTPEVDKKTIEHLQHTAKEKAVSSKEIGVSEEPSGHASQTITRGLKLDAYRKTLQRVRGQLSGSQRLLSRVIHQPALEKISNAGAQTAARPSGILGGAIFAFLGSVTLLVMSKRLGFTYNYLVFFGLFIGGFVVGLIVELLLRTVRRTSKR